MVRLIRWTALIATTLVAVACKGDDTTGTNPNAPSRGFRMGFSAIPPRS